MLTGEQIRAARALARLEQAQLAAMSGVSLPTIKRLEKIQGPISANTGTEAALRKAFEGAGVIVIDENGEGPGVRLRKELLDRGELHSGFEALVDALLMGSPLPSNARLVLDQIRRSPRTSLDILPRRVSEAVGELDPEEERTPGTYGEAVGRVERALISATRADG